MNPRRWIIVILAGGLLLHAVLWYLAANRYEAILEGWIEARAARGDKISHAGARTEGYPGRIRITLTQPRVNREAARVELSTEKLILSARPWRPFDFEITAPTKTILRRAADDTSHGTHIEVESMHHTLRLDWNGQPRRIDTETGALAVSELISTDAGEQRQSRATAKASAGRLNLDPAGGGASAGISARLSLEIFKARPADPGDIPMSDAADLSLEASLRGKLDNARTEQVIAWRDAGGLVEIDRLSLDWAPIDLIGDGTLALDAGLQPVLAASLDVRGLETVIDRMVAAQKLKRGQATVIKLALAALTRPARDGGAPVARIPLTLQDRRLKAGPLLITEVPRLIWSRDLARAPDTAPPSSSTSEAEAQ